MIVKLENATTLRIREKKKKKLIVVKFDFNV